MSIQRAQGADDGARLAGGADSARDHEKEKMAAAMIEGVRRAAAEAARRADEIDKTRKMPPEIFDAVEATNIFRALAPKEYGGFELPLEPVLEGVMEGARGNGSLGWLMMVHGSQSFATGMNTEQVLDELFKRGPHVRLRGMIAPKGKAIPTEGGYIVSGQWPFASGGPNPDYVSGNCIVYEDGKPKMDAHGHPVALLALMPASAVTPVDTWHTVGMRGTDSCDYVAKDVFVAKDLCLNLLTAKNLWDTPVHRLPLRVGLSTFHCAVALGIAQGALDDITELAKTKRASMNPKALLGDDPTFRQTMGEHALRHRACKALMHDVITEAMQYAIARRDLPPRNILEGRTMAAYITYECVKIVDWAYTAGGSASVYEKSQLQRRLRDIHVATQHASCHVEPYRLLAATMLGEQLSPQELF